MSNVSTRTPATATVAQPAKTAPSLSESPMELTGLTALREASAIATHWWSQLEMMLESHKYGVDRKDSLPEWLVAALGTWQEQNAAYELHRQHMELAKAALQLADEGRTTHAFEVWSKRGHRLDGRYDFHSEAEQAMARIQAKHPGAFPDVFVARVHRRSPVYGTTENNALLDTLIGRVFWAGCSFAEDDQAEEVHEVQDETGRCVAAPLSVLLAHKVFGQMRQDAQERLTFAAADAQRKAAARAAATGAP